MGRDFSARAVSALLAGLATAGAMALVAPSPALAQEDWKPFAESERRRPPRASAAQPDASRPPPLAPMDRPPGRVDLRPTFDASPSGPAPGNRSDASLRQPGAPLVERPTAIERSELPPIEGTSVAGQPGVASELWRGLDAAAFERLITTLELPPRSPTLLGLWKRLLTADAGAPSEETGRRLIALRSEALYRAGLLEDAERPLGALDRVEDNAVLATLAARSRIALGDIDSGCPPVKAAITRRAELPVPLKAELILLSGLCAAAAGHAPAAGLAADLARDEGIEAAFGLSLLDAIAAGSKGLPALPKSIGATEYRLMQRAGIPVSPQVAERAAPALLSVLAAATSELPPRLRLAAAEAAARLNVIGPEQLGEAWRAEPFPQPTLADPLAAKVEPAIRRALLFQAGEKERNSYKKTRLMRALLDDARRVGLMLPALALLSRQIEALTPVDEIAWFAETAIEAHLVAGSYESVRRWIAFSQRSVAPGVGGALQHWLALADIADARLGAQQRGTSLESVEALALRGRFSADLLHRMATVLDALDYHVPIPLWEAASRTPQPATGHLPPTGVLTDLQDAARKAEQGRTVLLVMQTIGANGAEGAHMIALGDAIRALKRARMEPEARRLAFEALFIGWPRTANN